MQGKKNGGLDMVNLESFIKGLHIKWINTLTGTRYPLWKECNFCSIKSHEKLLLCGSQWARSLAASRSNSFWKFSVPG